MQENLKNPGLDPLIIGAAPRDNPWLSTDIDF